MSKKRPPGKEVMSAGGIALITTYLLTATILIIWTLVTLWPAIKPKDADQSQTTAPTDQTTATAPAGQTPTPAPAVQTPTPTPAAQTPTPPPAAQTPTPALAGQNVPPRQTQPGAPSPVAIASVPAASVTPSPGPDACEANHRIVGEFCLDEKRQIRKGVAPVRVFGLCRCLYDEDRLLLLVLLAGALGSLIHGLRSFVWYVGNRRAVWSWSAYYVVLPFIGAGIAFIFYLVIRGGFFASSATVTDTSPVGFIAIAALIGMFTEQAVQKLKGVSETILAPAEKGKDHIDGPKITTITPKQGPPKGGNEVSITGENFSTPARVTIGGLEANVTASTSDSITLLVPPQSEGKECKADVVVVNTDNLKCTQREGYEYKNDPAPPAGPPPPPAAGGVVGNDDPAETLDGHDADMKADTPDEELTITEGGVS